VRDPDGYRTMDWPVWCKGFTPITGKWRMETVEVNGVVEICGVQVRPGDLVCADEAGVAFVPRERAAELLAIARSIDAGDSRRKADIDKGMEISALLSKKYK
jgi:regulator of RNase E activity RraA